MVRTPTVTRVGNPNVYNDGGRGTTETRGPTLPRRQGPTYGRGAPVGVCVETGTTRRPSWTGSRRLSVCLLLTEGRLGVPSFGRGTDGRGSGVSHSSRYFFRRQSEHNLTRSLHYPKIIHYTGDPTPPVERRQLP